MKCDAVAAGVALGLHPVLGPAVVVIEPDLVLSVHLEIVNYSIAKSGRDVYVSRYRKRVQIGIHLLSFDHSQWRQSGHLLGNPQAVHYLDDAADVLVG